VSAGGKESLNRPANKEQLARWRSQPAHARLQDLNDDTSVYSTSLAKSLTVDPTMSTSSPGSIAVDDNTASKQTPSIQYSVATKINQDGWTLVCGSSQNWLFLQRHFS
jgi:hypothetical protein